MGLFVVKTIMNRKICIIALLLLVFLSPNKVLQAQRAVPIPYGNMDQWIVRKIHESAIIGGKDKLVYELGPSDTVVGNYAYSRKGGSPWENSNVMAKVAGVVKTNTSVFPERRGNGWCARMETRFESVKVLGLVNIEVIAAGSIFLGKVHEPITGTRNPQSIISSGIPYTSRPKAIRFDYKVKLSPANNRIRSTGFSRRQTVAGRDTAVVVLLLQKRWEDKNGNIFARRVGTMVERFTKTTDGWIENATFPILYGNITNDESYRPYMGIQFEERYDMNSRGESVPIKEIGWSEKTDTPTHVILQFCSSHGGAYVGSIGNTLWIDNVEWIE